MLILLLIFCEGREKLSGFFLDNSSSELYFSSISWSLGTFLVLKKGKEYVCMYDACMRVRVCVFSGGEWTGLKYQAASEPRS